MVEVQLCLELLKEVTEMCVVSSLDVFIEYAVVVPIVFSTVLLH